MTALRLHPSAAEELEQAVAHYDEERPGWGSLFFGEAKHQMSRAALLPRSGARVERAPHGVEVRAFGLDRFPYRVIIAPVAGEWMVIAIAHTRREPRYWIRRVG